MIACTDVYYREEGAIAACILFHRWDDERVAQEIVERIAEVEAYEPGKFYRRELPCVLKVLRRIDRPLKAIIVDGYAQLGGSGMPGLGGHFYQALGGKVPVIGVAKSSFKGAWPAARVLRGRSRRPLYVSAAGMDLDVAAEHVKSMHGPYRIPTLLKRVDELCRSA